MANSRSSSTWLAPPKPRGGAEVADLGLLEAKLLPDLPHRGDDAQPAATDAKLRAQIEANDLSPRQARYLQTRVDRVIARTDGTQVAINQVVWDGGDTLVPLPGERRARELGTAPRLRQRRPRALGQLQVLPVPHLPHPGLARHRESHADLRAAQRPRGHLRVYRNNQTPGTRARFYDSGVDLIAATHPAPFRNTVDPFLASATFYIRPC